MGSGSGVCESRSISGSGTTATGFTCLLKSDWIKKFGGSWNKVTENNNITILERL